MRRSGRRFAEPGSSDGRTSQSRPSSGRCRFITICWNRPLVLPRENPGNRSRRASGALCPLRTMLFTIYWSPRGPGLTPGFTSTL